MAVGDGNGGYFKRSRKPTHQLALDEAYSGLLFNNAAKGSLVIDDLGETIVEITFDALLMNVPGAAAGLKSGVVVQFKVSGECVIAKTRAGLDADGDSTSEKRTIPSGILTPIFAAEWFSAKVDDPLHKRYIKTTGATGVTVEYIISAVG